MAELNLDWLETGRRSSRLWQDLSKQITSVSCLPQPYSFQQASLSILLLLGQTPLLLGPMRLKPLPA